ncbi:iron chelate uptake ABC transporter family permease subunit [Demequina sp. SYSU T00068]|uniref:iron chelate uptake ABC transporter family permease subunit n=1 Tax=Demequina lignilytica TaxID=3051663 RepID=UPI00261913E3|nr:iron chelate uptake ABC transporter family permease subunit [Demequina sp. SYSU T00068]MDN4491624.1 iron chelate uptake ABC transporter family permease subunit [Demequina sp. SYSU T00068]
MHAPDATLSRDDAVVTAAPAAPATTASSLPTARRTPPGAARVRRVVLALTAATLGAAALLLTWGVDGHWDFALPRRLETLAALVIVGAAVAVATVVFQTVTASRILTPSIMGFDSLYVLVATLIVWSTGAATALAMPPLALFALNTGVMLGASLLLFRAVIGDGTRGLYTTVLAGVIAGTLFSSISGFLFRVMDPNAFDALMADLFASFTSIDTTLLAVGAVVLTAAVAGAFAMARRLDVLALGRDGAIGVGLDHRRTVMLAMALVAVLVSVSTTLVGPVTFLGLLVANLAYRLTGTHRHGANLLVAMLVAAVALVLGQAVLQHVLAFNGTLGSLISLVGGVVFIAMLIKESRR